MVNDLITSFENYRDGHKLLWDDQPLEDQKALAHKITSNYVLNKQAFRELDHYKANGQILGKHPLMEMRNFEKKVGASSVLELNKMTNSINANISRNKAGSENQSKSVDQRKEYLSRYKMYLQRKEIVNQELNRR